MIKIIAGNILKANEDIICHQVNVQGIMGGGLARQLADKYSELEESYSRHCMLLDNNYKKLKGTVFYYFQKETKIIANMFSQEPNFNTDYKAIEECFTSIMKFAEKNKLSVAIPYGIGCGIANGNWNKVYEIIEKVFKDYYVTLYKLGEKQ